MIKSLIYIAVIATLLYLLTNYGDVYEIIMLVKGYLIFLFGIVLSREAIFMVNFEVMYVVFHKLLRHL